MPPPVRHPLVEGMPEVLDDSRVPTEPGPWLTLMLAASATGALTGLVGGVFRLVVERLERWRLAGAALVDAHHHLLPFALWLLATVVGVLVSMWIPRRFAPETAGSGIPRVEAVLRNRLRPAAAHVVPAKFLGGLFSIGAGLALGREGPTVQMGGTLGRHLGDELVGARFARLLPEPWTLIAAGAGAGLASAFDAPLAGVLFVLEELLHRFSARVLGATVVASATATVISRGLTGPRPELALAPFPALHPAQLLAVLLIALAASGLGMLFNRAMLRTIDVFEALPPGARWATGALLGLTIAALGLLWPAAIGGGELVAERAISHPATWTAAVLVGLLAARALVSMVSYATGAPGGVFAPLLALGALLGLLCGKLFAALGMPIPPSAAVVVAMVAVFSAAIRSPLTGVVLLLEMTGASTLVLPMLVASGLAFVVPEFLQSPPLYDSLRARDERIERARREALRRAESPQASSPPQGTPS